MFEAFKSLILFKRFLKHLSSIDSSLLKLVDIHEQNFKLSCIKAKITPQEVRGAEVVTGEEALNEEDGTLLQQSDSDIKELDDTFRKFREVMGREPAWNDTEAYIKKIAEKEPG